tara:strand:- start:1032 stop:1775 length:744 start_codon:yes stop_codon:yes gene_type:complete
MKKKILILGASSDMGLALIERLNDSNYFIGAHCFKGKKRILKLLKDKKIISKIKIFTKDLSSQKSCWKLVDEYVKWSKGIDCMIQLNGNVSKVVNWDKLKNTNWEKDIAINLGAPFFSSQRVFKYMKNKGGKIILMSTASAKHGGGKTTLAYGVSKAGVEALTKALAREGGQYNILVNAIAPGLIDTRFHKEKLGRSLLDLKKRKKLAKLKRMGKPEEIAAIIENVISKNVNFMTGEVISVSGGDWL